MLRRTTFIIMSPSSGCHGRDYNAKKGDWLLQVKSLSKATHIYHYGRFVAELRAIRDVSVYMCALQSGTGQYFLHFQIGLKADF